MPNQHPPPPSLPVPATLGAIGITCAALGLGLNAPALSSNRVLFAVFGLLLCIIAGLNAAWAVRSATPTKAYGWGFLLLIGGLTSCWACSTPGAAVTVTMSASLVVHALGRRDLTLIVVSLGVATAIAIAATDMVVQPGTWGGLGTAILAVGIGASIRSAPLPAYRSLTETRVKPLTEDDNLIRARAIEQQKLESLGLLAGGVAHDFNNLLASMLGAASLGLMDLSEDHPSYRALSDVETAAKRARELVSQLLAYAGRAQTQFEPVELNGLVREMSQLLETAVKRDANLNLIFSKEAAMVYGDPGQLRQVVMNLITNAAQATRATANQGARGAVEVRTVVRDVLRDELDGAQLGKNLRSGTYVVLSVRDSGEGMDEATLAKIFDPFFTTKATGRGLGLAAVLGIIRAHRGAVQVASTPNQGTNFNVLLPFAEDLDADVDVATVETSTLQGWRATGGRVLLADDEPLVRRVTRRMLEKLGFDVDEATDGADAVERFDQDPDRYILVVADLTMPRMDGREAVERMLVRRPGLFVVITTGYAEDALREGLSARHGFLPKPYHLKDLARAVDEAFGERGPNERR